MRTNKLRDLITTELNSIKTQTGVSNIYYDLVPDDAMYPHIVFSISSVNTGDLTRKDFTVDIDIYTKSNYDLFEIADEVEDLFINKNDPTASILPTFYLLTRVVVEDPDKTIKHTVVRMQVQQYDHL